MMTSPALWAILDGYLNTGDYDDNLDGWVGVERSPNGDFSVYFTASESGDTSRWTLCEVTE